MKEDTFERDIVLSETESAIRRLAEKTWLAYRKDSRIARTVVLKHLSVRVSVLAPTEAVRAESSTNP
jgi:DNA polymerase IV